MLETGAHALGCTVFPGGAGQTEQQVRAMAELKPDGYVGTPSFLRIILEKADELGVALPSLRRRWSPARRFRRACATRSSGAASPPIRSMRPRTSARSPTSRRRATGLIVDEGVLVEIVRPGTGDPVAPGEVGEVVVTTLVTPTIR